MDIPESNEGRTWRAGMWRNGGIPMPRKWDKTWEEILERSFREVQEWYRTDPEFSEWWELTKQEMWVLADKYEYMGDNW